MANIGRGGGVGGQGWVGRGEGQGGREGAGGKGSGCTDNFLSALSSVSSSLPGQQLQFLSILLPLLVLSDLP